MGMRPRIASHRSERGEAASTLPPYRVCLLHIAEEPADASRGARTAESAAARQERPHPRGLADLLLERADGP